MPVLIAGVGPVFSIVGTWVIKIKNNEAKEKEVQGAFNLGNWGSLILTAIALFFIIKWMLPAQMKMEFFGGYVMTIGYNRVFYAVLIGLAVGGLISMLTEYYTAMGKKPVMGIIQNFSTEQQPILLQDCSRYDVNCGTNYFVCWSDMGAYSCAGFLWCSYWSICDDGNNGHAISN